jgi:hypothetical protein
MEITKMWTLGVSFTHVTVYFDELKHPNSLRQWNERAPRLRIVEFEMTRLMSFYER